MKPAVGLLCFVLMLGHNLAHAECEADRAALQWLERMSHSLSEVSYQGVFTYRHGNSMQTLRISHSVDNQHESASLSSLDGEAGSVRRTQHPLDCIHPGHKLVRISSGFQTDDCGLARNYRLQLGKQARVAGRTAQTIQVLPRDMYRYGYRMALDTETGLLLRSQTLAQDGRILEHFQFADLQIGAVEQAGTEVKVVHEASHPGPAVEATFSRSGGPWQVSWVPAGFTRTDAAAPLQKDKTFTDGLAVFSVYLERLEQEIQPGEGRARQGGTTAYTRGMRLGGQPVLVTVVGEVPVSTARMVADSVNWQVAANAD